QRRRNILNGIVHRSVPHYLWTKGQARSHPKAGYGYIQQVFPKDKSHYYGSRGCIKVDGKYIINPAYYFSELLANKHIDRTTKSRYNGKHIAKERISICLVDLAIGKAQQQRAAKSHQHAYPGSADKAFLKP